MPFLRNRNILLMIFSVLFFVVSFSESPESRSVDQNDITTESTVNIISNDEFVQSIKEAYLNNCISGTRIMMESGEQARYRYEYVLRSGNNKVVSLTMPYRVTWYRYNQKGYIILDGKRLLMEDKMKDLEDVFLDDLENDDIEIKITEIFYSGIPAYYASVYGDGFTYRVIVLKQSMNFIRLEKQTHGKLMIMFYDNLNAGDKVTFENQMIWYQEIPLGTQDELTSNLASETSVSEGADNLTESERLLERFFEIIAPLLEVYVVQKTEVVKLPDADAMFITMSSEELENPFVVSVVLYKSNSVQQSENIFGKIPENYNHYQKIKENIEVNVIGVQEEQLLKSIADMIISVN